MAVAGGSAAASLAELGYNVLSFCLQDTPRRAHSIAAQGGINAAKNYQNDGDSVCANGETVRINDRTVAHRARHDSEGRALPHWSGCRQLSADEVFLMGDTEDSFDSRYFGPVSVADIEGVWRPIF